MQALLIVVALATALSAAQATEYGVAERINDARALAQEGRLKEALAVTEALAVEVEESVLLAPAILGDLARLQYRLGDLQAALASADAALEKVEALGWGGTELAGRYLAERATYHLAMGHLQAADLDLVQASRLAAAAAPPYGAPSLLALDIMRKQALVAAERGDLWRARAAFAALVEALEQRGHLPDLAQALLELAGAELRLEDAEAAERSIARAKIITPADDPAGRADLTILKGRLAMQRSDLLRAEALFKEAATLAADDAERRGHALLLEAGSAALRGDGRRAEALHREALGLLRTRFGSGHPVVGRALVGLALLDAELGQPSLAADLMRQAVRIFEDAAGAASLPVAEARVELAMILRDIDDPESALQQASAAVEIFSGGSVTAPLRAAYARSAFAFALEGVGRDVEAADSFGAALSEIERIRGPESSDLPPGLIKLAEIEARLGRTASAEARLGRARAILVKDRAAGPRLMGAALTAEINVRLAMGDWDGALTSARTAVAMMRSRSSGADTACRANRTEQVAARALFEAVVRAGAAASGGLPRGPSFDEMFEAAQFPHLGETAATLAASAGRAGLGPTERALWRRQAEIRDEECALETAMVRERAGLGDGDATDLASLAARLARLRAEAEELQARLGMAAPSVLEPRPVTSGELAATLGEHEAMLLQLTGRDRTHLFWIARDGVRYASTGMDAAALRRAVTAVRRSVALDQGARFEDLPRFPVEAAYELYQGVFAPFTGEIAAAGTVYFVPDAEMRALPPALLLRSLPEWPPENGEAAALTELDWMVRGSAVAVLPAPDALVALHRTAARTKGKLAFVGIGDPDIGERLPPLADGADDLMLVQPMRPDGMADPRFFRTMPALDDAGRELEDLARIFDAPGHEAVVRGAAATESWVRTSAAVGEARVLVFATHGLVAGEFARGSEPALVLTPPRDPSAEDDGLLTTSEIATLSLSSDWVILSACNTAAGRNARAEGLSGLARAFAHAGARSLMVSHWYVPSEAAASLSVFTAEGSTRRGLDRAQALRDAMLRVMAGEDADGQLSPRHAHPVYWSPFVIVGAAR